jgi:Domain of unknown function (DUF4258)
MPVTLTMRMVYCFLLIIFLIGSCHPAGEPFDRHGYLILTKHARCRMDCRHITMKEIHEILENGSVNYTKSEPDARPDPKYAVEGFTEEHQHLRIIIAPENGKLILVTCIELGMEWQCDCN